MKKIIVIAEVSEGKVREVTWELVAAAGKIKDRLSCGGETPDIHLIIPCVSVFSGAGEIAETAGAGIDVTILEITDIEYYTGEVYIACLYRLIKEMNQFSHILVANTSQGRDFAFGLALRLGSDSISGVNGIRTDDDENILFSRPVSGNTENMIVKPDPEAPVLITIMPGVFSSDAHEPEASGRTEIKKTCFNNDPCNGPNVKHISFSNRTCENQALKNAKIIVAAGRGVGEKENLAGIFTLAEKLPSSAVGASRPLVDMGWISYDHQVGITGSVVSPQVYIACGISGSSQHIAGMKDAEYVVSINKNPAAPIFRHSDICITEDAVEFIQAFLNLPKPD
jgi:electron transfer flavoprotein alpha subunit